MEVSARAWSTRPNNPEDKVRELQRKLYVCAKRSRTRRFHALYDRIYRGDVLWEAWRRVRSNRGAAGIDGETHRGDRERAWKTFSGASSADSEQAGTGRTGAAAVHTEEGGKKRPLGIPTVRDRVVQMAAKLVIEPIFEADFLPSSYGFRPKRSATQALEAIREGGTGATTSSWTLTSGATSTASTKRS